MQFFHLPTTVIFFTVIAALTGCVTTQQSSSNNGTSSGQQGADVRYDANGASKKPLTVKQTERGVEIVADERVFFDSGKFEVKPAGVDVLKKVAEVLKTRSSSDLSVEGHTDNVGNAQTNQALSQRRAEAVRTSLLSQGVPANRVKTIGYGMTKPIASNDSAEGKQTNRRTELIILGEKEANITKAGEPSFGESLSAGFDKFLQNAGNFFQSVFGGKKD
jgi:outer membrane protein OmpA-like peptidoglycan-associated protein